MSGKFYGIVIVFLTSNSPTLWYIKLSFYHESLEKAPLDGEKNLRRYLYNLF